MDAIKLQNKRLLTEIFKLLPEKLKEGLSPEPECEKKLMNGLKEVIEDYMELQV